MNEMNYIRDEIHCRYWKQETGAPMPLLVLLSENAGEPKVKPQVFLSEKFQQKFPCSMLLVEAGADLNAWEPAKALRSLLFELEAEQPEVIDGCRMYLVGSSAAWTIGSRFPRRFAAVVALGGRGDPHAARSMKFTPVWAFGSTQSGDRRLPASPKYTAAALRSCGSQYVRYTEVPVEKSIWDTAFSSSYEVSTWMFEQNRRKMFEVTYLRPGVFRIDDYFTSSAYLVCGTEKALLIDTGMGEGDLHALVRSLTPLPVEVAVTHPHEDHMANAAGFSKTWLHQHDIEAMDENRAEMAKVFGRKLSPAPKLEQLCPLNNGTKINLGGGVIIEAVELGGHTPNSVVFIDRAHECVFTGDAIGSGYIALMICSRDQWRQMISHYRDELIRFREYLPSLQNYAWYGGHFIQENGCDLDRQEDYLSGSSTYYLPISEDVVNDMALLCGRLLSGEIPESQFLNGPEHYCEFQNAGMIFRITDL